MTRYERDATRIIAEDAVTTHEWVTADGVVALASRNGISPDGRTVRRAQYDEPLAVVAHEDGPKLLGLEGDGAGLRGLEGGHARVAVFDALGRRAAVLHDGPLGAGRDRAIAASRWRPRGRHRAPGLRGKDATRFCDQSS